VTIGETLFVSLFQSIEIEVTETLQEKGPLAIPKLNTIRTK
jgi:hypothetical protein